MNLIKQFFHLAIQRQSIIQSLKISLFVGTLLALINHFDSILLWQFETIQLFRILLTYFIPYAVSTYSSVAQKIS